MTGDGITQRRRLADPHVRRMPVRRVREGGRTREGDVNQDRGRRADAARAGYDSLAWADAVNAGRRWCHRCQAFEPVADFGRDGWRWDGLTTSCRRSRRRGRS